MIMVIAIIPPVIAQELKNLPFSENIFVVYNHQLRMGEGEGLVLIKSAGDVEISVGLQSTSNDEFTFSDSLIERINQESSVQSIVFTNMEEIDQNGDLIGCVPGVKGGNQCILINLDFEQIKKFITDEDRNEMDGNVKRVQIETKRIGNSLIDEINQEFQSTAKFHSVYIQKGNEDVDLEKVIEGTISAVYIMPKQNSMELFDKFSNLFISKKISGGGGFYDIANDLSNDETYGITRYEGQIAGPSIEFSTVAMTIFSDNDETRYMLNTSTKYYNVTPNISEIKPLDPLFKIDSANTHVIEKISAIEDIAKKGWFFEQSHGNFVAGKFLFGQSNSVSGDDLIFYTSAWDEVSPVSIQSSLLEETVEEQSPEEKIVGEESEQSQYAILAVIIVVAIAAAIYYMKGYKSKH